MFDIRSYVDDSEGSVQLGSMRIPHFFDNEVSRYKKNRIILASKMDDIINKMGIVDIPEDIYNGLSESFDETESIIKQNKEYVIDKIYNFRDVGYKLIKEYHADEIPSFEDELDSDIDSTVEEVNGWNTEFDKPPYKSTFI